jgi:epoxyqueuosine reductase
MPMTSPIDTDALLARAHALGFAQAALIPSRQLDAHALDLWLAEARHHPLDYMHEHPRTNPSLLLPKARTLLVVTASYHARSPTAYGHLHVARYAHGLDYHEVLRARLALLADFIVAETGAHVASRSATDSAPLLERALASRAGLGWVGKNTLLIHPKFGSYAFIAELLLDLELNDTASPQAPRCGRCTRCLDACPTQAIIAPHVLDARRCISTWTIESSGPIPRWIRPRIGSMLFGCDICQEVCPWNSRAPLTQDPAFLPPEDRISLRPEDVVRLTSRQFNRIFAGSPILRAGRHGLARNAAVVLGNKGDERAERVLMERAGVEGNALVRAHIAWALGQVGTQGAIACLHRMLEHDTSSAVREEAWAALDALGMCEEAPLGPV